MSRKKIIAWGVAGAFVFRIFFAFGTEYMLEYAWIKIVGGLALLWIVYNIRQDLFGKNKIKSPEIKSKELHKSIKPKTLNKINKKYSKELTL